MDAGHFQLEMDFANYTYDTPIGRGQPKAVNIVAPMNLKVGVLNNVDFQFVLSTITWHVHRTDNTSPARSNTNPASVISPRASKVNLWGDDGGQILRLRSCLM